MCSSDLEGKENYFKQLAETSLASKGFLAGLGRRKIKARRSLFSGCQARSKQVNKKLGEEERYCNKTDMQGLAIQATDQANMHKSSRIQNRQRAVSLKTLPVLNLTRSTHR